MSKLAELVHKCHLFISWYIVFGLMFSYIHSKILLGLIPSVYGNWLVNDHKCLLTVLEHKLIEKETNDDSNVNTDSKKDDEEEEEEDEGLFWKMLKSRGIDINNDDLNKVLTVISYHSLLESYINVILT